MSVMVEAQINTLRDDKYHLEQDIVNHKEENKQLNIDLETANKSILDKERSLN